MTVCEPKGRVVQAKCRLPRLSRECRNQAGGVGSRLLGRARGTEFCGAGSGFQPAMVRAQARACAVSVTPGNSRRNSTAADSSPCCSKAARIAAASASVTTIIPAGWMCPPRATSARASFWWVAEPAMAEEASRLAQKALQAAKAIAAAPGTSRGRAGCRSRWRRLSDAWRR